MRNLILVFSLVCGSAWASNSTEGFDYLRGKIDGRATVTGQWATLHIEGDAAEAMYYQMSGKIEKDTGCSAGISKRRSGFLCTKVELPKGERFECFIDIDLKNGIIRNSVDGTCPEEDYDEYLDKKGHKFPRTPAQD
jgi:hypothetical protein